jgi:hypothetical protein
MSIFEDVTLIWKGNEYTVESTNVMKLIAKVEREITIEQLLQDTGVPRAALAMAYTVALQHAGAKATHDEVYLALFKDGETMVAAVSGLLSMMMPPETYKPQGSKEEEGKPEAEATEE